MMPAERASDRLDEMRDACRLLEALGVEPWVARAAGGWLQELAAVEVA